MAPEITLYVQLAVVLLADYVLGDPRLLPHPVRFIGWLCVIFEGYARDTCSWLSLKIRGMVAFFLVLFATLAVLALFFFALTQIAAGAALLGAFLVCFFCIAAGDLVAHSNKVYNYLNLGDMTGARQAVSLMVGRDTALLDDSEVARACVESVSENMVDGITAPLFWAFIFSFAGFVLPCNPLVSAACGCMAYKAVNTMDSMYGYKNERYLEFGWFAARVDDVSNIIPARASGLCLIGAAYLLGFDGRSAARIYKNDRFKSSSPNSGHSEAAAAGALGIELGGPSVYFGEQTSKPFIGKGMRRVGPEDIKKANRLVIGGSLIFFICSCLIHLLLVNVFQ